MHPFSGLLSAAEDKDPRKYENYFEEVRIIFSKLGIYESRKELLDKLAKVAPDWARSIKYREGVHGETALPDNIDLAWKWSQLNQQIERINSYDPYQIQKDITFINESLMQNARKLAYERAWYFKILNRLPQQTQAIEGWRQTMRQLGRGTGRNAPMLRRRARELMPKCQMAIPVWIMPLNSVAENFDPQENSFDVVIIDEASQANILALSALYLGKKIIIVGDDEQVSPDSVGIRAEEINAVIEQHLEGVPNRHLYNGKTSVYDMAKASGFIPIMLTEHFRCLPDIIEFSNRLSYNGKIKPLRDASRIEIKPQVVSFRVPGALRVDKVNWQEAEHIASLVCALINCPEYLGKSIGVISLVGQNQAYEIDRLLQKHLDPRVYEGRRILCGNPAQFQGDERDIIFLSVVDGPREEGGPIRLVRADGRNDMYRKRYNVASSRGKDQMWVVHSLNPDIDLQPDDIRFGLIKHAMHPSLERHETELKLAESDFEKRVMKTLLDKGYKVFPQWKVGAYRIDMVVEDGNKRVALECDGEKWHTLDNLADDLKRQAVLERLGWRFTRIRGSEFYRDPSSAMERIYGELADFDIRPNYLHEKDTAGDDEDLHLLEEIKRSAEEIRRQWAEEESHDRRRETDEGEKTNEIEHYVNSDVSTNEGHTHVTEIAPKVYKPEKTYKIHPTSLEKKRRQVSTFSSEMTALPSDTMTIKKKAETVFDFRKNYDPIGGRSKSIEEKETEKISTEPPKIAKPRFNFTKK